MKNERGKEVERRTKIENEKDEQKRGQTLDTHANNTKSSQ